MVSIYDDAKSAYDNLMRIVEAMAKNVAKVARDSGGRFDVEGALYAVDVILEYSLIEICLADGKITKEEIAFIQDLTKFGSFVDYWQDQDDCFSWDEIKIMDPDDLQDVLNEAGPAVHEECGNCLVSLIRITKKMTGKDYLPTVKECVNKILEAMRHADGFVAKDEQDALSLIGVILKWANQ